MLSLLQQLWENSTTDSVLGKAQETLGAYERTMRTLANNFGKQTAPLQPEKIRQALAAVESEKSPSGETYGSLFKEGKLP